MNKKLWILFGALYHLLSWGAVLIYGGVVYAPLIAANKFTATFIAAGLGSILGLRAALKETADNGYGLWARIARSIRTIIPVVLAIVIVVVLRENVGDLWNIMAFGAGSFILGQPFGVLSYKFGPAYVRDTGINKLIDKEL